MALVIPYGDTQAHGSIGDAISFRRWRGRVVMQKKPHPRQPNTSAQKEWRKRFKDCWDCFHNLDAWTLEYVTLKAAELGQTPANFYLSQCLLDEIPSNIPMNNIKQLTDISIPGPIAEEDDGIRFRPYSIKDDPSEEWLLGEIFDKENSFTPGITVGDHTRTRIDIKRDHATSLVIPFNYPLVVKWIDFNDVAHIDLIRFPSVILPVLDPDPSSDPMTDVKQITSLQLLTPIGEKGQDILINFLYWKDAGPDHKFMGWIEDKRDYYGQGATMTGYDNLYMCFRRWLTGIITIPAGYAIYIEYIDLADNPQSKAIYFPNVSMDLSTDSSETPFHNMEKTTGGFISWPLGDQPFDCTFRLAAKDTPPPGGYWLGQIHDNQNIWTPFDLEPFTRKFWWIQKTTPGTFSVPEGYTIRVDWIDAVGSHYHTAFIFPAFTLNQGEEKYFFISQDMSLYNDWDLTDLAYPHVSWDKKLWFSDDWSVYWDKALTQLARANVWGSKKLWLADDFSLYWDKEMTQLANTPFF